MKDLEYNEIAFVASRILMDMISVLMPANATSDSQWYKAVSVANRLKAESERRVRDANGGRLPDLRA